MKCEECGIYEAIVDFSEEPVASLIHGYGFKKICRRCYIARMEKALKDITENLDKQKALLDNGY